MKSFSFLVFFLLQIHSAMANQFNMAFWQNRSCPLVYGPGANVNGDVNAIVSDGFTTYIAGAFTTVNGVNRNRIAALDPSGNLLPFSVGASGTVSSLLLDNGTLYAAGGFTRVGGMNPASSKGGIVDLNGEGNPVFPSVNGNVYTSISDGAGGWIIGGAFTSVGGQTRQYLARIKSDLTVDPNFKVDAFSASGFVRALAKDGDTVYVGGDFTTVNGVARNRFVAIDINGTVLDYKAQFNGIINSLLLNGSTLYAGGAFTAMHNEVRQPVEMDPDGVINSNFPVMNGIVYAAIPDGSGGWYIGGTFTTVAGQARTGLARINADGSLHTFNPGVNGNVQALTLSGSTLYVGGSFTNIGGQARANLAALDVTLDTNNATAWAPEPNSIVKALYLSGTKLFVAGPFNSIGGGSRSFLAALDTTKNTGNLLPWSPNATGTINSMVGSGTSLYVGGTFSTIGGQSRANLAELRTDLDTSNVTSWNPGANSSVTSIALSGTTLFVAGSFSNLGGGVRLRLGAVSTTTLTNNATAWAPNLNAASESLAISGTTLLVGGTFTTVDSGGKDRLYFASYDIADPVNPVLRPGVAFDGVVKYVAAQGSKIIVSGTFTMAGGGDRSRIAAINVSQPGQPLTSWSAKPNNTVNAIALSGGTLYVGGAFTSVNGVSRGRLAGLDTLLDANNLTGLNVLSINNSLNSIVVNGNDLYLGGAFSSIDGQTRNGIAKIDLSSGVGALAPWYPNAPVSTQINSMELAGTTLYIAGMFTTMDGKPRTRLAAIDTTVDSNNVLDFENYIDDQVNTITYSPTRIFVGGIFNNLGGRSRTYLAAFDTSGTGSTLPLNVNIAGGSVAPFLKSGTNLYIGGNFTSVSGNASFPRLAAIDLSTPAGSLITTWNPVVSGSMVQALALDGDNLYVGGTFTTLAGQTRNNVGAVLTTEPNTATAFNPNASSQVTELLVSDTGVYLAGGFGTVTAQPRPGLALVDKTTGAVNLGFNANAPLNLIKDIKLRGSNLYVGGAFSAIGGSSRLYLAALNPATGLLRSTFSPSLNASALSLNINNNTLQVGGQFTSFGGDTNKVRFGTIELCP